MITSRWVKRQCKYQNLFEMTHHDSINKTVANYSKNSSFEFVRNYVVCRHQWRRRSACWSRFDWSNWRISLVEGPSLFDEDEWRRASNKSNVEPRVKLRKNDERKWHMVFRPNSTLSVAGATPPIELNRRDGLNAFHASDIERTWRCESMSSIRSTARKKFFLKQK